MSKTTLNNTPRETPGWLMRWFTEGELKCSWCGRPMPAGFYGRSKVRFLCSPMCIVHFRCKDKPAIKCECCGQEFVPQTTSPGARFCCREHFDVWRRQQTDLKKFGRFAGLVRDFVQAVVPGHRTAGSVGNLRGNLAHFFVYLRGSRLRSLEKVTSRTISSFFSVLIRNRPKSAGKTLADLALFFDWLILTGRRKSPNPVQRKLHSQLAVKYLPHPYTNSELKLINRLLKGCGDLRLELAVAIGLEAGLHIAEVCDLHLSDVDEEKMSLRVRTSNRTGFERTALFHRQTKKALAAWLRERPDVEHDYLLTANSGVPMRKHLLRHRLNTALGGAGKLRRFSFRRLAQTAAARVTAEMDRLSMMANFGWRSQGPIDDLRRLPTRESKAAYDRAMEQIASQAPEPVLRSESLDEYFNT